MRISIFFVIILLNCLNAARSGLDSSKPSGGVLNWAILQSTGSSSSTTTLSNRIFLSSSTTIGQFSSSPRLTYADDLCNTNRPSGVGTAKALIGINSLGTTPTEVRRKGTGWVLKANTDYYNLSGQKLFTTTANAGITCNQTMGGKVAESGNVWTGLDKTCDATNEINLANTSTNCSSWGSNSAMGHYGYANASNTTDLINPTDASGNLLSMACSNSIYLYCVEQ